MRDIIYNILWFMSRIITKKRRFFSADFTVVKIDGEKEERMRKDAVFNGKRFIRRIG